MMSAPVDLEKQSTPSDHSSKGAETDGYSNSPGTDKDETPENAQISTRPGAKAGLTPTQFWLALLGLNLGMFLTALDFNIVATAVPVISSRFNSYSDSAFIGTAFLIPFGALLPVYAKLSDVFGRNEMFALATVIFILGSGLCAGSKSMDMLIWSRAIQGIGGGGIYGLVNVIITDLVPLRDVGKYLSATIAVWAIADVSGPLLGGLFTQYVSWRWCFWINLIISPISLAVTLLTLKFQVRASNLTERVKNFDYLGTVLLVGGLIALLLGTSWGGNTFPWSDSRVIGSIIGGISMILAFGVWERFAKEPLVDIDLFHNSTVVFLCISEFFVGMNILGMMYYVPQFLQLVFDDSPTHAGLGLLPMMLGLLVGHRIAGFFTSKFGISWYNAIVGNALITLFSGLVTRWHAGVGRAEVYVELVLLGLGQGASISALLLSAQVAVKPALIGIVTGLIILFMIVGNGFGISLFSAVYVNELAGRLHSLQLSTQQIDQVLLDIQAVKNFPTAVRESVVDAYADSLQNGWWLMFAAGAASLIAVLFARQHKFEV